MSIRRRYIDMWLAPRIAGCEFDAYGDGVSLAEAHSMSRLTITLDDGLLRALEERAARQGRSIESIIEESLRLRGIQTQGPAHAIVDKARERAQLEPDAALDMSAEETRAVRDQ